MLFNSFNHGYGEVSRPGVLRLSGSVNRDWRSITMDTGFGLLFAVWPHAGMAPEIEIFAKCTFRCFAVDWTVKELHDN
jgi:hypothetical protein